MNTKNFFGKALLTLGLTFGGLAAAQTPLAFQSVRHESNDLSLAINETWAGLTEHGYSGSVTEMTDNSVSYEFSRGNEVMLVTVRQTSTGVLIITKDSSAVVLASR